MMFIIPIVSPSEVMSRPLPGDKFYSCEPFQELSIKLSEARFNNDTALVDEYRKTLDLIGREFDKIKDEDDPYIKNACSYTENPDNCEICVTNIFEKEKERKTKKIVEEVIFYSVTILLGILFLSLLIRAIRKKDANLRKTQIVIYSILLLFILIILYIFITAFRMGPSYMY